MKTSIHTAEHYTWGDINDGWHLLKNEKLSVISERMPPGSSEVLHCHSFSQQLFYILSGTARFELNEKIITLSPKECIHVPSGTLHRISNIGNTDLEFLVISEPKAHGDRLEIIEYTEDQKSHVKALNVEWLEKYFRVEPNDEVQLSDPEREIVDKGGLIYYARVNNLVVGTVTLIKMGHDVYELGKMAVTEKYKGQGIGKVLIQHCFNIAAQKNIKKLVLYSNTKLANAIYLYRKFGFEEVQMESGHYERANIKMEKVFK